MASWYIATQGNVVAVDGNGIARFSGSIATTTLSTGFIFINLFMLS